MGDVTAYEWRSCAADDGDHSPDTGRWHADRKEAESELAVFGYNAHPPYDLLWLERREISRPETAASGSNLEADHLREMLRAADGAMERAGAEIERLRIRLTHAESFIHERHRAGYEEVVAEEMAASGSRTDRNPAA